MIGLQFWHLTSQRYMFSAFLCFRFFQSGTHIQIRVDFTLMQCSLLHLLSFQSNYRVYWFDQHVQRFVTIERGCLSVRLLHQRGWVVGVSLILYVMTVLSRLSWTYRQNIARLCFIQTELLWRLIDRIGSFRFTQLLIHFKDTNWLLNVFWL